MRTQKTLQKESNTRGEKGTDIPHSEKELIFKVDSWIGEAIEREKTDEKVFLPHDKSSKNGQDLRNLTNTSL